MPPRNLWKKVHWDWLWDNLEVLVSILKWLAHAQNILEHLGQPHGWTIDIRRGKGDWKCPYAMYSTFIYHDSNPSLRKSFFFHCTMLHQVRHTGGLQVIVVFQMVSLFTTFHLVMWRHFYFSVWVLLLQRSIWERYANTYCDTMLLKKEVEH